jgi:hypothetical protein
MMKHTFTALLCAGLLMLSASSAAASPFSFSVVVNTTPLVGNPGAPFYLDFQLTDGSGLGNSSNAITISNFDFGAGSAGAAGTISTFGGGSGNLASSVSLTDSAFFNEFFQQFVPGASLTFTVSGSSNVEPGLTPDAFAFSILDSNFFNIPTTGLGDSLVFLNLNKPSITAGDIQTAVSTSPAGISATVVPEPATLTLLLSGFFGAAVRGRKQQRTARL